MFAICGTNLDLTRLILLPGNGNTVEELDALSMVGWLKLMTLATQRIVILLPSVSSSFVGFTANPPTISASDFLANIRNGCNIFLSII